MAALAGGLMAKPFTHCFQYPLIHRHLLGLDFYANPLLYSDRSSPLVE